MQLLKILILSSLGLCAVEYKKYYMMNYKKADEALKKGEDYEIKVHLTS